MSKLQKKQWVTLERPGYQGTRRDAEYKRWDELYGKGNWQLVWEDTAGNLYSIEDIVFKIFAEGYAAYFRKHLEEAAWITENFSHAYDLNPVPKKEALNLYYYYRKSGVENQFHHVAFNYALVKILKKPFKGGEPLWVRPGKRGSDPKTWPQGWRWHPGRIPCIKRHQARIPTLPMKGAEMAYENAWYQKNSIEHFYQATKALQIRSSSIPKKH